MNGKISRVCFVCGKLAAPHDSFVMPNPPVDTTLHVRCALRLTRDLLDLLQHVDLSNAGHVISEHVALSPREIEVLEGIVRGERDREIGQRLGMAEHTVKNHAYAIRHKLGVRSRTHAAVRAMELGLVPDAHSTEAGQN